MQCTAQTYSCPRDWRFSVITALYRIEGFKEGPEVVPMIPRDTSLSDSFPSVSGRSNIRQMSHKSCDKQTNVWHYSPNHVIKICTSLGCTFRCYLDHILEIFLYILWNNSYLYLISTSMLLNDRLALLPNIVIHCH